MNLTKSISPAVAILALGASTMAANATHAQAASPSVSQMATTVATAHDQGKALLALKPEVRQSVVDYIASHITVTSAPAKSTIRPAGSGCWYDTYYAQATYKGVNFGEDWMTLSWCGNGSKVTSHSTGGPMSGSSNIPGAEFISGGAPQINTLPGWEVREARVMKWRIGISGYNGIWTHCSQIRGGASGMYSTSQSCEV